MSAASSRMRGSIEDTNFGVKAPAIRVRIRLWSGGSEAITSFWPK